MQTTSGISPTITDRRVRSLAIGSLTVCAVGAGINVSLYVTVLELQPVTGKMVAHTGDTKMVCAAMS